MRVCKQISAMLINKPGRLANVCSALAKQKINIIGLSIADAGDHGVLRMVADDPERAKKVLSQLGTPFTETQVLCCEVFHHPGAIAALLGRLAAAHINVEYVYVSAIVAGGKTTVILKVSNLAQAQRVLGGK